jgi:hypothetical protein
MSHSLKLSPLPSVRSEDHSDALLMEREGFVDEKAVSAMVSQPFHTRSVPCPEDLVLSLDDMDFAGWHTAAPAAFQRGAEVPPQVIDAIVRRSAPPVARVSMEAAAAAGSTRWWLAGLAGALTTLIASVVFVGVSPGPRKALEDFFANAATALTRAETLGSSPQAEEGFEP